MYQVINRTS